MKFYPADWQSDAALRMCSLASRGLWLELIAIAHHAVPYGHVLVAGLVPTTKQLVVLCGATSEQEITDLLAELSSVGVFDRGDDGRIISRRMVRDEKRSEEAKSNGKEGGNPRLKGGVKGGDKAQRPDTRGQIPEAKSQKPKTRPESFYSDFQAFYSAYPKHVGRGQAEKAYESAIKIATPEDILAGAKRYANAQQGEDPQYIAHPATWLNGQRWLDGVGDPEPPAMSPAEQKLADWRWRITSYREKHVWSAIWGPRPGEPDCEAPPAILAEFGIKYKGPPHQPGRIV